MEKNLLTFAHTFDDEIYFLERPWTRPLSTTVRCRKVTISRDLSSLIGHLRRQRTLKEILRERSSVIASSAQGTRSFRPAAL